MNCAKVSNYQLSADLLLMNDSPADKYTSRGHRCGIYNTLVFVESKALKQAHSKLRNCFSNAAIGKNSVVRNPQS